jgi:ubiquinone/menaquinone biosynthesis C-methylase UbiE
VPILYQDEKGDRVIDRGTETEMTSHASKVGKQFGTVAEAYLSSTVHSQGADLEAITTRLRDQSAARVLDLGCGAGHLSFAVAPQVEAVVAYDLSAEMIDIVANEARRRDLRNVSTQRGQVESLPFEDASFDWVCTRYSAHHWTEIRTALLEARRVLKRSGGLMVIDTCAPTSPLLDTHLQTIELLRDTSHVRNYTPTEWKSMLTEAGFVVGAQSTWKLPLDFNAWIGRMKTPAVYVDAIRSLLHNAPREVIDYFHVAGDGSFTLDTIMMEAG